MWDDYRKLVLKDCARPGCTLEIPVAVAVWFAAAVALYSAPRCRWNRAAVPVQRRPGAGPRSVFILLTYLVIVGSSNAVNLTDGLDGLAILPTVLVSGALGCVRLCLRAYADRRVPVDSAPAGVGELAVLCGALVVRVLVSSGSTPTPAQVFAKAMSVRWRWVPRWARWRSRYAGRSHCSSVGVFVIETVPVIFAGRRSS